VRRPERRQQPTSRILRHFQDRRLIVRKPSRNDGRKSLLQLTDKGERAFASINAASQRDIGFRLRALSTPEQVLISRAMPTIQGLLVAPTEPPEPRSFVETVCLVRHLDPLPADLRPQFVDEALRRAGAPLTLDYVRLNMTARRG